MEKNFIRILMFGIVYNHVKGKVKAIRYESQFRQ